MVGAKSRKELEDLIKLSEKVAIRDLFSDTEQETLLNFFKFAVEDKGFDAETLAQINASLKKLGLPGVTENGYSKAVADYKFITETAKSQVDQLLSLRVTHMNCVQGKLKVLMIKSSLKFL